jgi:hypothetical protein
LTSNLALAAASSATAATGDLLQIAHEGGLGSCRTLDQDTIPQLADALKMTIEHAHAAHPDFLKGDVAGAELLGQLKGAVDRFLEGWA